MSALPPSALILMTTSFITHPNRLMPKMPGVFKRHNVHLSPEVKGQILSNEKPVPNATIIRELTYGDEYTDQTRTDDEGFFQLPEKWIRSRIPERMFDETRIRQVVDAEKDGQAYLLWYANTPSIHPEQTVTEKLGSLCCDLSTPERLHHFPVAEDPSFTHDVYSICRWE